MDRGPLCPVGANRVTLLGILGIGPIESRTFDQSLIVTVVLGTQRFRPATNAGERAVRTDWHRVVAWGNVAENALKTLTTGCELFVEGALINREWRDRSGMTRRTVEVRALQMTPLGYNTDRKHGLTGIDINRAEAYAAAPPPSYIDGD